MQERQGGHEGNRHVAEETGVAVVGHPPEGGHGAAEDDLELEEERCTVLLQSLRVRLIRLSERLSFESFDFLLLRFEHI